MRLNITGRAHQHFVALLQQEAVPNMGIRVFVEHPHSRKAEVGVAFCPPEDIREEYLKLSQGEFNILVAPEDAGRLEEATIDFEEEGVEAKLIITAPFLQGKRPAEDATLAERVSFILDSEINPSLAQHKGMVSLVEVTADQVVVLRFGGGCHGCGMADITLKQGIERSLKEQLPEIREVRDVTDHTTGTNPYYV